MMRKWGVIIGTILTLAFGLPIEGRCEVGDGAFVSGKVIHFEGTSSFEIQGVDKVEFEQNGWTCTDEKCQKSERVDAKCNIDASFAFTEGALSHWKCTGSGVDAIREISRESPFLDGIWIRNSNGICHVSDDSLPQDLLKLAQILRQRIMSRTPFAYACPKDELFVVARGAWAENMATVPCYDNGEPCVRLFFTHEQERSCLRKTTELEDAVVDELCMDARGILSAGAKFEGGSVRNVTLRRVDK